MPSSSVARWLRRDGVVRCREGFHSAGTRAVVPMVVLHGLGRLGYLPFASIAPPRLDPFAHDQRQHPQRGDRDRKSTRLNSSHGYISYAVFCLKKKKTHPVGAITPACLAIRLHLRAD